MDTSPNTIAYADLPERWGITCEHDPSMLRIVVPPVSSWRHLSRGLLIAVIVLSVLETGMLWMMIAELLAKSGDWPTFAVNGVIYGIALVVVLAIAAEKMSSRIIFEMNASHLSIQHMVRRKVFHARSWPRSSIGYVKLNRSDGKLLLWITGQDMVEVSISPEIAVTEWVAHEIDIALRTLPLVPADTEHPNHLPLPMRSGATKTTLLMTASILGGLGVIMIFVFPPLSLLFFLAAAAPAGIALGMQDKQYYFY